VIYGFPAIDGVAGGLKVATEQYDHPLKDPGVLSPASAEEIAAMHAGLVASCLPGVGPRCVKAVPCLYTATPDFHFVLDRHPDMPGVTIASPCSGHGFKHSAAVGEGLAQRALGEAGSIDFGPFALARLAR
jgi:sarcosine oxidase